MHAKTDDVRVVFLISQPRSGSTLLQYILAGDPTVQTAAEPWLMLHPIYALRSSGHDAEYSSLLAYTATTDFLKTLPDMQEEYIRALRRMAMYLYGRACKETDSRIFLDKTPRYYFIIPELARVFPEAKFILLFRNPLAVLHSVISTWVKGNWLLLGDYYHDLVTAPSFLLDGSKLLRDRSAIVYYEALVQHPAEEVKRLCEFLELSYHPGLLTYTHPDCLPGRFGDPVEVYQSSYPQTKRLNQWFSLGKTTQMRYLAKKYLDTLGPSVVDQLGYRSSDLIAQLARIPVGRRQIVVPWNLIFKQPKSTLDKLLLVIWSSLQQGKSVYSRGQIRALIAPFVSRTR